MTPSLTLRIAALLEGWLGKGIENWYKWVDHNPCIANSKGPRYHPSAYPRNQQLGSFAVPCPVQAPSKISNSRWALNYVQVKTTQLVCHCVPKISEPPLLNRKHIAGSARLYKPIRLFAKDITRFCIPFVSTSKFWAFPVWCRTAVGAHLWASS